LSATESSVEREASSKRRAIPAFFFPLLSQEDAADPERIAETLNTIDPAAVGRSDLLVYLHIPFCQDLCHFCGFYRRAAPRDRGLLDRYVDRLLAELAVWSRSGVLEHARVKAVYIGGGTPSLLPPELIGRLLRGLREHLPLAHEGVEFSFEGEARTLGDESRLAVLRELGVTRVSFGVQSMDPEVRRLAGLGASLDDVRACAEAVRGHDYAVCADLIFGLPGQTPEVFRRDLTAVVDELGASLIDLYELILYPNAAMFAERARFRSLKPTDEERRAMYGMALEALDAAGFLQWTLEDFCRPGHEYEMKHLVYGGDDGRAQTLALGACAVGYLGGQAYRNQIVERYLEVPREQLPIATLHRAADDEIRRRPLFFYPRRLYLRPECVPGGLTAEQQGVLEAQVEQGLVRRDAGDATLRLSPLGMTRADDMVRQFLTGAERRKLFKIVQ